MGGGKGGDGGERGGWGWEREGGDGRGRGRWGWEREGRVKTGEGRSLYFNELHGNSLSKTNCNDVHITSLY